MADVYELNTIADLLKVPVESLDACLRDLRYALELCHFAGGEDTPTMAFDSFAWTDDGRHDIDMSMNGEPFLKLNVTDDAALSHAAGQDGEQCRVASGLDESEQRSLEQRAAAWDAVVATCLNIDRNALASYGPNGRESIVAFIRALSRGVLEGMVLVPIDPTPEMETAHRMYGDTSDWWQSVISAAIAAQQPILGVTGGTDEGWGS